MKEHEKRQIAENEIRSMVQKELKHMDIRGLVDQLMSQIIEHHMREYSFPEKSIPAAAIDFNGFKLDVDLTDIGSWDNFKSGGITDNATQTQITIGDNSVHINNLSVDKIDLRNKVRIGDETYVQIVNSVVNQAMAKFKDKLDKVDWAVENIVELQNERSKSKDQ